MRQGDREWREWYRQSEGKFRFLEGMGESLSLKVKGLPPLMIYPIIKRREKNFLLGQGESISRLSVLDYATILDEMG